MTKTSKALIVVICIAFGNGCSIKEATYAFVGGLFGAGTGAAIGALAGGSNGAVKGAIAGATAGVVMGLVAGIELDEENKPKIQQALELNLNKATTYKDSKSGDEYTVIPRNKYKGINGDECVDFIFINVTKNIHREDNGACRRSSGKFEFVPAVNDTLQPPPPKKS
ncbi:MAG: hypothetical protein ACKN9T_13135 [Candidatus Methylumidiphilus sp.]